MSVPSHPSGYDTTMDIPVSRSDCHLTVGFDRQGTHIPRFLIQLHYATSFAPVHWESVARFDHNETGSDGHDVYQEGIHIDISKQSGGEVKVCPPQGAVPHQSGKVIRWCIDYFNQEADYIVSVYEGDVSPANPPGWPDGGDSAHRLLCENTVLQNMQPEPRGEDTVSKEELTEILADTTGTTAKEIDRGVDEIAVGPLEEGEIVETEE